MGFSKSFKGLSSLPEVKELITTFRNNGYTLGYCEDMGMRMDIMNDIIGCLKDIK